MKKRHYLIITLISLFVVSGIAAARHGFHHGGFDEFDLEAAVNRIASRLDLSDAQKNDLQETATEIADRAREIHGDREARRLELAELVRKETISRETMDRMMAEKFDKMKELADFAADRLLAFHGTLSPEQRQTIAERIENHATGRGCFFRR